VFLTIQSMVMWGLFSPFILTRAELLEFDTGKRLRAFALHLVCALVLSAFDVAIDMVMSAIHHLEEGTFAWRFYREVLVNTFSYAVVVAIGYALVLAAGSRRAARHAGAAARAGAGPARRAGAHAAAALLFNALNTVAALVRLNENKRALSAVVALSDLLRIVLKTRGEARIPLSRQTDPCKSPENTLQNKKRTPPHRGKTGTPANPTIHSKTPRKRLNQKQPDSERPGRCRPKFRNGRYNLN
jgi:hypothetical protein